MKIKHLLSVALLAIAMASCHTPQDITYMQNAETLPAEVLKATAKINDPVIMPGDMLQISVSASNPELVKFFNKTEMVSSGSGNNGASENSMYYYLVDNKGNIDFPMLGQIKVGGKTQSAVEEEIGSLIYPRYITEKPGVEVRFQNFHVYTMGEVSSPGQIKAANGRITILEAIAQSGDLTIHGRRDNVMVIHTNADGSREVQRVNLTDKNLLVSPVYNLRQNDVIYVEPNASKQRSSWSIPP
ncbi:MAG: polysaccharide biosynthesis/export family protein, partial [Bacteroidales bacterium]|nr:polysaccharide biosynthesis/export family protein [Bacteroidales bacterium]